MKRQHFKLMAQTNLDHICERIEELEEELMRTSASSVLFKQLEDERDALIEQYNALDAIPKNEWSTAMLRFIKARDLLLQKLKQTERLAA
ncbi:hypothetical protein MTsPCn5_38050 [Croceitalea sp. MTPC5]|uniref:hypothetical protein n=1 Tax=Croceitalea sp. MTPC5 TaxID=3056565 RepID=UPI002B3F169F|nr:hypothetical protein MTsPCn5_38050 [Croceitalea sp. MTPC5]